MTVPVPSSPLQLGPWPSAGRDHELQIALQAVRTGGGVELCGAAGVGKTHLSNRIVEHLVGEGDDWIVVSLAVTEARSGIPLSALEPVLGAMGSFAAEGVFALIGEVSNQFDEMAGGRQVLVQIDDAHLLDDFSAETLASLCRMRKIRLVTTTRSAVKVPSALSTLWKDAIVERLDIEPFDFAQTGALVRRALGGPVVAATLRSLWELTQGNLFYIRETVRDGVRRGDLVLADGAWSWRVTPQPGRSLVDVVKQQLNLFSDDRRQVVELVALCEPVAASVVLELCVGSELDALADQGILTISRPLGTSTGGAQVSIAHPLYATAVRQLVPPDRRRNLFELLYQFELHDDVLTAGQPLSESLPHLMRSVAWGLECNVSLDYERLLAAAKAAAMLSRHDFAVRIAGAALNQLDPDDPRVIDVRLLRASALRVLDRPREARRDVDVAAALIGQLGPDDPPAFASRLFEQTDLHARLAHFSDDDVDAALAYIERTSEELNKLEGTAPELMQIRRRLRIEKLVHLGYAGRHGKSLEPSLVLLRDPTIPPAFVLPLVTPTAVGLAMSGRLDECIGLLTTWFGPAREQLAEQPWCLGEMMCAMFGAALWRGDVEAVGDLLWPAMGPDDALVKFNQVMYQLGVARVAIAQHRWSDAKTDLEAVSATFKVNDSAGLGALARSSQALVAAATGDTEEARRQRREAQLTPLRTARVSEADFRLPLLMVGVALREDDAVDAALEFADACATQQLRFGELLACHIALLGAVMQSSPTAEIAGRIQLIGGEVDGPLARAVVQHASAVSAGDSALVAIAIEALTRAGEWVPLAAPSVELSRRQREVATLAAKGLSSKEIAERLFLSVRTVESHLGHVFTRLGVHSRSDLPAALARQTR